MNICTKLSVHATSAAVAILTCATIGIFAACSSLPKAASTSAVTAVTNQKEKVPDLVGKGLQVAKDELETLGFSTLDIQDASGEGRIQIIYSNWQVCTQDPAAGSEVSVDTTVMLAAVKLEEKCSGEKSSEGKKPSESKKSPESKKSSEGKKSPGIGDPVTVDDLTLTVTKYATTTKIRGIGETHKGNWALVSVKVKNGGKKEAIISSGDFTLKEPDGTEYSTDSDVSFYVDKPFSFEDINPKTSKSGTLVFSIPKSAKNLTLNFSNGWFGGEVSVKLT